MSQMLLIKEKLWRTEKRDQLYTYLTSTITNKQTNNQPNKKQDDNKFVFFFLQRVLREWRSKKALAHFCLRMKMFVFTLYLYFSSCHPYISNLNAVFIDPIHVGPNIGKNCGDASYCTIWRSKGDNTYNVPFSPLMQHQWAATVFWGWKKKCKSTFSSS